jgi:hypothetical protein
VESAVNAAVAVSYSGLIRVTGGINATAQCHAAGRPAKPPAKPAGSQHRTTKTTSKDRRTSRGCASGGRATPGIGVEPDRYKITHWFNLLIFPAKSTISRAPRYKMS